MADDFWLPLVEEPIGELVGAIQAEDEQIASLVASPRRQLAFRTFAYVRVGVLLGRLLVERDVEVDLADAAGWVERLLEDPEARAAVVDEVRAVAREVADDPALADEELGPDPEARERFREFARRLEPS
jgi:hypothetical protein